MEKEINIADILRDKPKGTKLYDKLRGRTVSFDKIGTQYGTTICATYCNSFFTYKPNGKYDVSTEDGIQILVPSKEMQDWSKFAWKKGDVLKVAIGSGCSCIFDRFTNDDYTEFTGVFDKYLDRFDHFATSDWCKVTDKKEYKSIIQRIEAQFGGKLNLETLEIERQPEFKDGDIIQVDDDEFIILKRIDAYTIYYHYYYKKGTINFNDSLNKAKHTLKLASKADQLTILSSLKNIGKKWNPDTKQIENLPKKFKPFDKVLVRDNIGEKWKAQIFSHYYTKENTFFKYICVGASYTYCIPYEGNEHLLGTTDNYE